MKKRRIAVLAVMACFCTAAAAGSMLKENIRSTADIPEHDGDVLVDSVNITETTGEVSENTSQKNSEMVTSDDVSELEQADTYFREMRASITLDRNEMIAMFTDAAATAETSSEKENANSKKNTLLDNMQKELDTENAITAKGLPECLVLISENGVNVTVNKKDLSEADVARICDIVMRETGRKASEIIVQSKF